ncbi:FAD-dependent oxidoreductase [Archangium lansingense]|uniref:FAD-dependent oxidoreductase n=1 Tax=Archangium lansingense TaxID=2995310 RepID=UPI003B80552B
MNQQETIAVLIVGAGPTGLTLACDLRRRGVACRVIDKAPEFFSGSRGKGLQPRSLEVLDDLGVLDAIRAVGAPYPPLRAYVGARVVWEGRMHEPREPTPDVPYPLPLMVPQWRTEEVLRARLAELGGHVELATELVRFEQDADGVNATLVHAGGAPERVRARYLVGADGGRSHVRKQLGVGFEGETHETDRMLIGDLQVDGLDRDYWHVWSNLETRALKAGLCPLAGTDLFQLMVPLAPDEEPGLALEDFQRLFNERSGRADLRLHGLRWASLYRVNIRMVDRYRVGRVLLAGDAAHVHTPAGGQGLNTGIQDAYNLGWKLGAVCEGAPATLLDTYEQERLPVAAEVLGLSTRLYQNNLLGQRNGAQRGAETEQLGLNYRGGPLARDEREAAGDVQAGDRAPDAPCHTASGEPVRLFDVFRGPHFTLLAFGVATADTVARINARHGSRVRALRVARPGESSGEHVLVDTHGHARTGYALAGDALVLVRPDGYIGLVTPHLSADAVERYLSSVTAP